MDCKSRRSSYQQANQQSDVLITNPEHLLFELPQNGEKMKCLRIDGKFLATDGCDLLEMDWNDKTVRQFHEFQKVLIWSGLRFHPKHSKCLTALKFHWLFFTIGLGIYTAGYDFYFMWIDFNSRTAPTTLVYGSVVTQSVLIMFFSTFWQQKLLFESFFHIYRHTKIEDVDFYDSVEERLLKRTSRQFWGLQIYSLAYIFVFVWATWAKSMEDIMHPSYRYTFYFPELVYIRCFMASYYFMIVGVCLFYYCCLTNALHIEIKKFNWKISQLQKSTNLEMREQLEELIHIHTKLSRCVRSMDSIFKVFTFTLTTCVIPTIIFVLTLTLSRSTIADFFSPTVTFCLLEYYGIMYPARIHEELSKSKALLCMNYNVWIPYEESVYKIAHALVMHLDQADLGISLWGFTMVSKPLIFTTVSAMMTCLAFFLDFRPKGENFGNFKGNALNATS